MAFQDMPLSDLDSATSVGDSDLMYIVQGGVSKKATRGQATSGFAHLVNGTVPLSELPKTALDNLVKVANDTARFALTTAQVQNGDSVEVLSTDKMYLVVDDTKLDEEAGYKEYAATVDWSTIQGKPNNLVKSVPVGAPSGGAMSPILHESDVVDALNSSSTTSPLSANQGKNLKQNVDTLSQSLAELISYSDVVIGDVTMGSGGYADIRRYLPTKSGYTILFVQVADYGQGKGALSVDVLGRYISGTPSQTWTNVTLRYFFIKNISPMEM